MEICKTGYKYVSQLSWIYLTKVGQKPHLTNKQTNLLAIQNESILSASISPHINVKLAQSVGRKKKIKTEVFLFSFLSVSFSGCEHKIDENKTNKAGVLIGIIWGKQGKVV